MSDNWYYVENNERVGPVQEIEFIKLIEQSVIDRETYVWKKGFDNWIQAGNLPELNNFLNNKDLSHASLNETRNDEISTDGIRFSWSDLNLDEQIFVVKIGSDRGQEEKEFGPYSFNIIMKLIESKRVNEMTQIFAPGMSGWQFLGEISSFSAFFN